MIKKIALPFLFLLTMSMTCVFNVNEYRQVKAEENIFILQETSDGQASVTGVNDQYLSSESLRLYSYVDDLEITSIAENAFVGCDNLISLMLPRSLTSILDPSLNRSELDIYFTGSLDEFASIGFDTDADVHPYSFDEGFINLWNDSTKGISVCDVKEETYRLLNSYYINLGIADRVSADSYVYDESGPYTIKQGMEQLKALYSSKPVSRSKDADQSATLIVVVVIAIIGMTSICVFYSFKENELIS